MEDDTPPSTALVGPVTPAPETMPGRNGGVLRRGNAGNKGGGRPASAVREALRSDFARRRYKLKQIADNRGGKYTTVDQLKALDLMAKYGLGVPMELGGPDGSPFTVLVGAAAAANADD